MPASRRRLLKILAAIGLFPLAGRIMAKGVLPIQVGLRRLTGPVLVNGDPAREGMLIRPGDTVVTGRGAEAVYVVGDSAFLQRSDTRVVFGTDAADFLRVVTGRLLSVFGKGRKRLQVPTATIGIRGTACYIEAGTEQTYFCLCYGIAEITPSAAPQATETVETRHHDHPLYINGTPDNATSMVPAEVMNHSDEELVMLEELVGRWPPFYTAWNGSWPKY